MVYNPDEIEKDYEEYNGGCWKCGKQLKLNDDQTNCDNCGSLIKWKCNSCNEIFEVKDKDSNKKLKECKVCGFFVCPHCGVCFWNCDKFKWQKEILNILKKDIPIGKFPTLPARVNEIVKYVEDIKVSTDRKTCIRNVPISYSKGRIKSLAIKADGFRVKNEADKKAFLDRIDEVTEKPMGTEIVISQVRENGSYGQEFRDALNMLVCLGKYKIDWRKNKQDKDYCVFVRGEFGGCKYFNLKNLIIKYCPKCLKVYDRDKLSCDNNCTWSKGSNKGQIVELKERVNNCDTCQMYRGNFHKKNG